jgi:hypothetical protein
VTVLVPSEFDEVTAYPHLRRLLEIQIDMQFHDLRSLLRLPRPELDLEGGCNLTGAMLCCNVIAGASVLFYDASPAALEHRGDRGRRFRGLMTGFYPWSDDDDKRGAAGAEVLYDYTRNPLSHSLGVQKNPVAFPGVGGRAVMLSKFIDGLPADAVDRLLSARERPEWVPATIRTEPNADVIAVETLAWGVHEMLRRLFADAAHARAANETAGALLARR